MKRAAELLAEPYSLLVVLVVVTFFSMPKILYDFFGPVRKLILVWGMLMILYHVIKRVKMFLNVPTICLGLFCLSNMITILVNYQDRLVSNCVNLGYVIITMILLLNVGYGKTKEQLNQEIDGLAWIGVWIPLLFSAIGLLMFFCGICTHYDFYGKTIYVGVYENRLWGLYNPNIGGNIAVFSFAFTCYLWKRENGCKKLLLVNAVLQMLYVILTLSRSAWYSILILISILILFHDWNGKEDGKIPWLKFGKRLVITIAVLLLCNIAYTLICKGMSYAYGIIPVGGAHGSMTVERIEEFDSDFASSGNGRLSIWQAGLLVWKHSPVWGVGPTNIYVVGQRIMSEAQSYYISGGGGVHNGYLAVLVISGVVGVVIFASYLVMLAVACLKQIFSTKNRAFLSLTALICGFCFVNLVEQYMVYSKAVQCILFWGVCGYLFALNRLENKESKE